MLMAARGLGGLHRVAHAANRRDQGILRVGVDLLAQPVYEHLDEVGEYIVARIPYRLGDHVAGNHFSRMTHQYLQQHRLFWRERQRFPRAARAPLDRVELEISNLEKRRLRGRPASRERLDACEEFGKSEWLYEVVVAAALQSGYAVID